VSDDPQGRTEVPPSNRQIEFATLQTHSKKFEAFMVGLSILCVIVVLIIVLFTSWGTEFRPTV
jgi:hypothetical protein